MQKLANTPKYPNGTGEGLTGNDWSFKPEKDVDWRGTGATYQDAIDEACRRMGIRRGQLTVTKIGKDKYGKFIPVEWRGPNKEIVNMDIPEWNNPGGEGPFQPHVGYQNAGKRYAGKGVRGHIFVDDIPATRK